MITFLKILLSLFVAVLLRVAIIRFVPFFDGWNENGNWDWEGNSTGDTVLLDCVSPWGTIVTHGESIRAYSDRQATSCESQIRTCNNGQLWGIFENHSCEIVFDTVSADCITPWWSRVKDGQSVRAYLFPLADPKNTCESEIRTCINWLLAWRYRYDNCQFVDDGILGDMELVPWAKDDSQQLFVPVKEQDQEFIQPPINYERTFRHWLETWEFGDSFYANSYKGFITSRDGQNVNNPDAINGQVNIDGKLYESNKETRGWWDNANNTTNLYSTQELIQE